MPGPTPGGEGGGGEAAAAGAGAAAERTAAADPRSEGPGEAGRDGNNGIGSVSASPAPLRRPGLVHRHSSTSSHVSQSPAGAASELSGQQRAGYHKSHKHVVGYGRMGRNASFHRTLSKIKIAPPAQAVDDDGGPPTPKARHHRRTASSGAITPASLLSPRPTTAMKRTNTSVALPRTASQSALKKNHSSGQLSRLGSSRNVTHAHKASKHERPGLQRSHTQPHPKPRNRSPPGTAHAQPQHHQQQQHQQPAVHFDVGNDDDSDEAQEMEGVDDQWTEESASASPNTTRDNTRNNTRQNSLILDPEQNPYARRREQAQHNVSQLQAQGQAEEESSPPSPRTQKRASTTQIHDFATQIKPSKSSYRENQHQTNLDADDIARRLLEKANAPAPPRVSSISALADAAERSPTGPQLLTKAGSEALAQSSGAHNTPMISRFIRHDSDVQADSKDGTPRDVASGFLAHGRNKVHGASRHQHTQSQPDVRDHAPDSDDDNENDSDERADREAERNMLRNKSAPNLTRQRPQSQRAPSSGHKSLPGSGATTPSAPGDPTLNQSRTQQKLWLQRGLSNIEASSTPHLPGLLPTGRAAAMRAPLASAGVGGVGKKGNPFEFVDKEFAVVRRFQNPFADSIARLRKLNGGMLPGRPKALAEPLSGVKSNGAPNGRPATTGGTGASTPSFSSASAATKSPAQPARGASTRSTSTRSMQSDMSRTSLNHAGSAAAQRDRESQAQQDRRRPTGQRNRVSFHTGSPPDDDAAVRYNADGDEVEHGDGYGDDDEQLMRKDEREMLQLRQGQQRERESARPVTAADIARRLWDMPVSVSTEA